MRGGRECGALLLTAALMACGGSQSEQAAETTATSQPVPLEPAPVQPVAEPEPGQVPREQLVWYVFWDEIHSLTIYPQPGPVRSEEPNNANATFRSDNPHFSVVSHYYEKEDFFAPHIAEASSLEDLLERVDALELVDVREDVNPIYQSF